MYDTVILDKEMSLPSAARTAPFVGNVLALDEMFWSPMNSVFQEVADARGLVAAVDDDRRLAAADGLPKCF